MKPEAVVFDLDGVITDTAHLHFLAWRSVAQEIGITIDEVFNEELKGISRMESLQRILRHGGKEGAFDDKQCLALAGKKNALYVASLSSLTEASLLPGIREVLADIRAAKVKLGSPPFPSTLLEYCMPWVFMTPLIFAPMPPVSSVQNRTRRSSSPRVQAWTSAPRRPLGSKMRPRAWRRSTRRACCRSGLAQA